jgi:hypothetical protein
MWKITRKVISVVPVVASLPFLALGIEAMQSEPSVPKCSNPAECNARGAKALAADGFAAADSFFLQELQLAEDSDEASAVLLALNNLAVSRIHQRDYLMARAWIHQALQVDSANPAAIHNLRVVEAAQRSFRWPSSPNGTYIQYLKCGLWNQIQISGASSTKATLAFSGLSPGVRACSDFAPSSGELEGQIHLKGKSAIYNGDAETGPCRIEIAFNGGSLWAEQQGGCGFGHGVYAYGKYERVSTH